VAVAVTNQLRQRAGVPGQALYTAGGRALGYWASVRLHLHQPTSVTKHDGVIGARVRVQVTKNKLAPAWQACELEVHSDHGLSGEASLLDLGLEAGVVAQRGSNISYGSVQLGRSRQAARRHLRDHPELATRLERELRSRLNRTPTPTVEAAAS
jgi:recombination protein RecA